MNLIRTFRRATLSGHEFARDARQQRHLVTVNSMAIFIAFYDLGLGLAAWAIIGEPVLALEFFVTSLACIAIPWLNKIGFINLSRLLFAFIGCVAVSFVSLYLGRETDVHIALLLAACSPFFIVSMEERFLLIVSVLAPALVYVVLYLVDFNLGPRAPIEVIGPYQMTLSNVFLAFAFMTVTGITYFFAKQQYDREQELNQANDQLAQENTVRVEAEKKLMKAKQRVETLIGILTHDIANSLMSCMLLLDVADRKVSKGQVEAADVSKAFAKLRTFVANMNDLTHKVVKMRSVQLDIDELDVETVQVSRVVRKIDDLFAARLKEKSIALRVKADIDLEELRIQCDEVVLVNQVLGNILSNAIKFSFPNNCIDFTINIDNDDMVQFVLRDYGIGIPDALIPKLFKAEEKTSRKGTGGEKGTGFGLPLCAHFVAKMHGVIKVRSWTEEGSVPTGTAFYVSIPKSATQLKVVNG